MGLITDHCDDRETKAIINKFQKSSIIALTPISISDISKSGVLKPLKALWYHRTDTTDYDVIELNAKKAIRQFIATGGNLFLSMEAFGLLNKWGFETNTVALQKDTVVDEGFGRPLGFHAFKDHAIFNGLQGGVYTSKQKQNHIVRKHGFFDNNVPANGKVLGIQWTYITFSENNKLLLEYDFGKGKIVAAGSYLYFEPENYQELHIKKFIENIFGYLSGNFSNSKNFYWDYKPQRIFERNFKVVNLTPIPAGKWALPDPTLSLKQQRATNDFYDLVGRKILWMGKMNGGVEEIWMHPFMALRDYETGIKLKNEDTVRWLKNIIPSITISPEFLTRDYSIGYIQLKEVQTVSFEKPLGVIHYEVSGDEVEQIVVRFSSNLRYMWPYNSTATKDIHFEFNKNINGHIISGQDGFLNTVVAYSQFPILQSATPLNNKKQLNISATFNMQRQRFLNVYISGSAGTYNNAVEHLRSESKLLSTLFIKSNSYYKNLLNKSLIIETPDPDFNEGYKWALARTDQFLQTSPGIGTTLMAGFGTTAIGWNGRHEISGRPGYAWYFGRDGVWSAMAIDAYGDYKMVKEVLESFVRYQDLDGKIYHELTSSGVAHYDAADATPLFIILAAHYLKYSGDIVFIKKIWPAIKRAYEYCKSTDTDNDGLIENTNVGHGWIEGGSLFGSHTELYLAACWAATFDAMSYINLYMGQKADAQKFSKNAEEIKKIIDKDFWNKSQNFFYVGKKKDGSYMSSVTGYSTVPIYLNTVIDKEKIFKINQRLSSRYFNADWGLRMLEDTSVKYHPGSYHSGMVWPLYSGWAALSEFESGHNISGYKHIMNNIMVYKNWALGSIEETLNGNVYKPNGVCHHQCWSETMVLQPAIEGMLGLKPDAMNNRFALSPYFAWHWNNCTTKNIKVGKAVVNMEMERQLNKTIYRFFCNNPIGLDFEPRFPLGTIIEKVIVNRKNAPFNVEEVAEGIKGKISTNLRSPETVIEITHRGGIGAVPIVDRPFPGESSKGMSLLSEKLEGRQYTALLQSNPGTKQLFKVFSLSNPKNVSGAKLLSYKAHVIEFEIEFEDQKQKYAEQLVSMTF